MARFLEAAAAALPPDAARVARALGAGDDALTEAALDGLCDPMYARALRALLRDTISPDVIHAGVKYNVIPGDADDRGRLPGPAGHDRARDAEPGSSSGSGRTSPPPAPSS